jgi:hypothetical protein
MAFGNALGNSIVNRLSSPSQLEQESASGDTGGQAGRQGQGASGASKTTSAAQTNSHKAANQAIVNEGAQPASALDGIDASILDNSEFDSIVADDSIPWDVRSKLVAQRGGRLEASGVEVYPVAPIADYPIEYLDLGEPSIVSTPSTGERSLWEQTKTFGEGLFELGVVSVNNSVVGLGGGLTFLGTWALTGDLDNALGFREYFTDQYGARLTTEGGQAMGKWIGDKFSWVDGSRNTAGDWALERFGPAAATAAYMWPEVVEIAVGGATRGARGLEFVEVQHTPGFKGQAGAVGRVQRVVPNKVLDIPQGMSRQQFSDFSDALRSVVKEEKLPQGNILVHGSRSKGTAIEGQSDIDVLLVVSDKEFGAFAAKRLAEASGGNRKKILQTVKNQQRIRARGVSQTFETKLWEQVFPTLPKNVTKVQFSIVTEGSKFNQGPYIPLIKAGE